MIMKFLKSLIKNIIPSTISYSGPFKNWKSLNNSNSYDKSNLQEYLFKQAKQVWENKEVYERDGHIFKTIHRSWHVSLSILEISKSLNKSNIKVCDFGGGYGTSYIENKFLINSLLVSSFFVISFSFFCCFVFLVFDISFSSFLLFRFALFCYFVFLLFTICLSKDQ